MRGWRNDAKRQSGAKRRKRKTTALDGGRPFFIGSMLGQAGYFLVGTGKTNVLFPVAFEL